MTDRETRDGIVAILREWGSLEIGGVALVRYRSDVARDECVQRLQSAGFESVVKLAVPTDSSAADALEVELATAARNGQVSGVQILFPYLEGMPEVIADFFHALNLRREDLLQRPLMQVWWISEKLSYAAEEVAPDLFSWLQVKLNLTEPVTAASIDSQSWIADSTAVYPHSDINNRLELEMEMAESAVSMAREHMRSSPESAIVELATALLTLAKLRREAGDRAGSLAAAVEAEAIYRELVVSNRSVFLPNLAIALNNLGISAGEFGDHARARAAAEEVEVLYRELAAQNPEAFSSDLALALLILGIRRSESGELEGALAATVEALRLYRKLSGQNSESFAPDLARSFCLLGAIKLAMREFSASANNFAEGLHLLTQLMGRFPDGFVRLAKSAVRGYISACQSANLTPDPTLLAKFDHLINQ